jgi:hypothetical protein
MSDARIEGMAKKFHAAARVRPGAAPEFRQVA